MKSTLVCLMLLCAASGSTLSAELSPVAKQEIAYLFSHLEKSGCEFNRNDSWHSATDASAHIQKKYQYLLKHDLLTSTESFIIGAASESSMSHKAYLVRCPGALIVESGLWFRNALAKYRRSHP